MWCQTFSKLMFYHRGLYLKVFWGGFTRIWKRFSALNLSFWNCIWIGFYVRMVKHECELLPKILFFVERKRVYGLPLENVCIDKNYLFLNIVTFLRISFSWKKGQAYYRPTVNSILFSAVKVTWSLMAFYLWVYKSMLKCFFLWKKA